MSWFDHFPISRVSIKLSFVLIVGGFLIFGAYGWYELNTERHALRRGGDETVRDGNLQSTLPVDRRDEMGAVAAEFNAMVAELREARRRLEQESESHRRLQHALQEADELITISQLSAGLAHEIGSPLQVLR